MKIFKVVCMSLVDFLHRQGQMVESSLKPHNFNTNSDV